MAWVEVRFEVTGEVQVARAFEASAHQAADMSEPLGEISTQIRSSVGEQFLTEGAHGLGHRWKPLDPAYAAWKDQAAPAGPGLPILVFSGAMRGTLLDWRAFTITPQRLVYRPEGTHADVAARHQSGEGVPERKIIAITEAEKRTWERTFLEWMRIGPLARFYG